MQIAEREVGAVTVLDLSGKITLGEGDTLLKDKLHSLLHQGKKNLLLNLRRSTTSKARVSARSSAPTRRHGEGGNLNSPRARSCGCCWITKLLTSSKSKIARTTAPPCRR